MVNNIPDIHFNQHSSSDRGTKGVFLGLPGACSPLNCLRARNFSNSVRVRQAELFALSHTTFF